MQKPNKMWVKVMKICKACNGEFPKTNEYFYEQKDKYGVPKLNARCKSCIQNRRKEKYCQNPGPIREARQAWQDKNRKRLNAYRMNSYHNNPEMSRISGIRSRFKVEPEYIMDLMNAQKGCCDVCGESLIFPDSRAAYAIDHDHLTGRVRGLLCQFCNQALGFTKDNIDTVQKMLNYLNKHKDINI